MANIKYIGSDTKKSENGKIHVKNGNYTCSEKISIRRPNAVCQYLISTNHFNSPDITEYDNRPKDNWYHTRERYATAESILNQSKHNNQEIGMDIAKGKHGFICQYDQELGFDTLWSVSYQVSDMSILRAEGNPSKAKYKPDIRLK